MFMWDEITIARIIFYNASDFLLDDGLHIFVFP